MNIWEWFVAFILGMVEGLTEFAPISSTGHMIIVDDMLFQSAELFTQEVANTFKVVIQLGSIMAVVIVFKDRFKEMLYIDKKAVTSNPRQRLKLSTIIIGLLPAAVLGFLFEDYIDTYLFSINTVIAGLIAGAFLMIAADKFRPSAGLTASVDQISWKQALLVGAVQCLALWPGFSRSGATISGGVLLGMTHRTAADFTFIMAVPIMLGAGSLSLIKNWQYFTLDALPFMGIGFISAFLFALLSIRFFLRLIDKVKLVPFAIYRLVLAGVLILILI